MPFLHNKVDRKIMEERLLNDPRPRTTISFYKYHRIENAAEFRDALFIAFEKIEVLGRIYVATEGINAQISLPTERLEAFEQLLATPPFDFLDGIRLNYAIDDDGKSFATLKVKHREKIVADGLPDGLINPADAATYLKAQEYNDLVESNPDVVVIDMRNAYEFEVGHFEGAQKIDVDTFREQLPVAVEQFQDAKEKPVVMYCTGGIRCEKASAYFKHHGFKEVYHLEGGIIEYARQAKNLGIDVKFKGKNFVFDRRLGEKITDDVLANCHQCGESFDHHVNCANQYCHTLFIQCPTCAEEMQGCCSNECKEFLHLPEEQQKELGYRFKPDGSKYLKRKKFRD